MLGPYAWSALRIAFHGQGLDFVDKMLNTHGLTRSIAIESGMLAVFFIYLRWRGWRPADFNIRIDTFGTLMTLPVEIASVVANLMTCLVVALAVLLLAPHPHGLLASFVATSPKLHVGHFEMAWPAIFIGSIVNAYLEELTFMGYAFHQFAAKRNVLFAVLVMVFLRMLLHTYKGPVGMLGIGAFSIVYGVAYVKLRRLWPLILGHILTDLFAFIAFKELYGT